MSQKIRQIIIYKIKADESEEFEAIKQQVIEESLTLTGLLSSTTSRMLEEANTYADIMIWASRQAADAAMPAFETLPTAGRFMQLWDGPPLYNHFMEFEPDQVK